MSAERSGIFYAAAMVIGCLGIGNMFQSNQAAAILIDVTGGARMARSRVRRG